MQQKQKLIGILILLLALGIGYFYTWPSVSQAYQDFLAYRETQKNLDDLQSLLKEKDKFSQVLQDFQKSNDLLFKAIPPQFRESESLATLYALAKNSGVEVAGVEVRKPDEKGTVGIILTLAGRTASVRNFLGAMEKTLPFFDLVQSRVQATASVANFNVDVQTYILPKGERQAIPYGVLKTKLKEALAAKTDILKDDRFKAFKAVFEIPVPLPGKDTVGGHDPLTSP